MQVPETMESLYKDVLKKTNAQCHSFEIIQPKSTEH